MASSSATVTIVACWWHTGIYPNMATQHRGMSSSSHHDAVCGFDVHVHVAVQGTDLNTVKARDV